MKNIYDIVVDLLKSSERYLSEDGNLLKANVYSDAMTMNKELIEILLNNESTKKKFFVEINNNYVFDKQGFAWFVEEKEFLPDSYTKYTNKIGLTSNGKFISQNNDIVIDFPFKDCVLEGGQTKEDQKRNEIFFNETIASDEVSRMLSPKVFCNAKRYCNDKVEENICFKREDNLIIKGNNLIALASIMKRYEEKIKCIYIDVPYNTGNDSFGYNDTFNHSTWLTFMKNRLELSYKLLNEDGFIFVQCDDNEQAYLKILMDEIFKRENFVNTISLKVSPPNGVKMSHADKTILKEKEYIHVYSKSKNYKIKPQYIAATEWDSHYNKFIKNRDKNVEEWKIEPLTNVLKELNMKADLDDVQFTNWVYKNVDNICQLVSAPEFIKREEKYKEKRFMEVFGHDGYYSYGGKQVQFLSNIVKDTPDGKRISRLVCDLWTDIAFNNLFQEGNVDLKNGKKPERLIQRILDMTTKEGDFVLDFFLGSGTTVAVAHKMKRKYIGIEQLDYGENDSIERIKNIISGDTTGISKATDWNGGGSFVYCELKENGQELVNEILEANEKNINEIKEKIINDDRIISYITKNEIKKAEEQFNDLTLQEKKKALISLIDKNKLYINYSDIDDVDYNVTEEEKSFTKSFYEGV